MVVILCLWDDYRLVYLTIFFFLSSLTFRSVFRAALKPRIQRSNQAEIFDRLFISFSSRDLQVCSPSPQNWTTLGLFKFCGENYSTNMTIDRSSADITVVPFSLYWLTRSYPERIIPRLHRRGYYCRSCTAAIDSSPDFSTWRVVWAMVWARLL